ncbi:LIM/homeobox protein Awh-like [Contarinia nasturtii]|uniref:LIM/homeobox protein Awh-like n=1 Tax=Contarinia nasturtii TaxID=265458 RepID=UPI0012D3D4CA|nr:LIM/homeobox protein Awh-like [Contarinia nasturtii]
MKSEYKCCTACEDPISDRYLLEVSGHAWHGSCLRCCVCLATLDEQRTCYIRDDQIYCKEDYMKFTQCAKCQRKITSTDWIRRAKQYVFHLACFSCDSCDRQLSTGEEFALIQDQILCREHYLETIEGETTSSDADSYFGGEDSSKKKIKRVRTAFTEEQLEVLQRNFEIDSNPDGQDLERIALNAGLSKRVTQVWFQNARARQKKHTHLGKRKAPYELNVHMQTNLLV